MIEISLLGKRIKSSTATWHFSSYHSIPCRRRWHCHHKNANELSAVRFAVSQFPATFAIARAHSESQRHPTQLSIKLFKVCDLQPLSSCEIPSKSLPLLSIATADKNGQTKRPNDESRSQNTRFIYSLTAAAINSNLHNRTHPRSRLVFPRVVLSFSAGITGIPR